MPDINCLVTLVEFSDFGSDKKIGNSVVIGMSLEFRSELIRNPQFRRKMFQEKSSEIFQKSEFSKILTNIPKMGHILMVVNKKIKIKTKIQHIK